MKMFKRTAVLGISAAGLASLLLFGPLRGEIKTPTTLKSDIALALPDNVVGAITAADLRNSFTDTVDSLETLRPVFSVCAYGAAGDGLADDTAEIQAAVTAALADVSGAHKPILYFPPNPSYLVTDTINIPAGIVVQMDGFLLCDVDQNEAGMVVGTTGVVNREIDGSKFLIKRFDWSNWTDENSIGLKLINLESSDVFVAIGDISGGFTIGVQCMGSSSGFVNNIVRLGRIINCKVGVDCTSENISGIGWCNENLFIGGRFGRGGGVNTNKDCIGIRITSKDGNNKSVNNNVFLKPSIELRQDVSNPDGEALPVLIEHGQENRVIAARNEGNGPVFARVMPDLKLTTAEVHNRWNSFDWVHDAAVIDDWSKRASTRNFYMERLMSNGPMRQIFDSGQMHKHAARYDATTIHVPDVHFTESTGVTSTTNANVTFFVSEAGATIDDANDEIDHTAHTRLNGDIVFFTGGSLPAFPNHPNSQDTYYVVNRQTNTFQISTTKHGTAAVLSAGSGTYHGRNRWISMASGRGVGRYVDTRVAKQFTVTRDTETILGNFGGRIRVMAFDGNGVQLHNQETFTIDAGTDKLIQASHTVVQDDLLTFTNSGGALPTGLNTTTVVWATNIEVDRFQVSLTKGGAAIDISGGSGTHTYHLANYYVKGNGISYLTTYGGHYSNGNDLQEDYYITVRDEVKFVNILMSGGSNEIRIRQFKIYVLDVDTHVETWVDYDQGGPGRSIATQAPNGGVYTDVGRVVFDDTITAGDQQGWVLRTAGPSGATWSELPGLPLEASSTWDPGNILDGDGETLSLTATGATAGDFVQVGAPYDLQDLQATGYVQATDTVEIRLDNNTGGAVDLGSGSWKVRVTK